MGDCRTGCSPKAYTAAANAIFANVRAKFSGAKLIRAPTKSTGAKRFATASKGGPAMWIRRKSMDQAAAGVRPSTTPGGGSMGVGRYRGNSVSVTYSVRRTPWFSRTSGNVRGRSFGRRVCIARTARIAGYKHLRVSRSKRCVISEQPAQLAASSVHGPFNPYGTACSLVRGSFVEAQ